MHSCAALALTIVPFHPALLVISQIPSTHSTSKQISGEKHSELCWISWKSTLKHLVNLVGDDVKSCHEFAVALLGHGIKLGLRLLVLLPALLKLPGP